MDSPAFFCAGRMSIANTSITGPNDSLDPVVCDPPAASVSADCLGDPPEVKCSCCDRCCNDAMRECVLNLTATCHAYKYSFGYDGADIFGYECECLDDPVKLSCNATACQTCNQEGSVCAVIQNFGPFFSDDGDINYWGCDMRYVNVTGRDEQITVIKGRDAVSRHECTAAINGQECNFCNVAICRDESAGYEIDCQNIVAGAVFDSCHGNFNKGGPLQVLGPEFQHGDCLPCYLFPHF